MRFYQIGLGSESEYAYLASRDRTCYVRGKEVLCQVPAPLETSSQWDGVLVDAHPMAFCESYLRIQHTMPDALERLTWVLGAVWTTDLGLMEFEINANLKLHHGWGKSAVKMDGYTPHLPEEALGVPTTHIHVASITVQQLVLKHGAPDFVVLDCEGAELPLLVEFMRHAPSCTAYQIEAHSSSDADLIYEIFEINGYSVITSLGRVNDRTEMQAIRTE